MPNKQIQSLTVEGVTYDIVDNTSGYINAQYIENKTDYSIPVSRAGEIIAGETAIGTDSTNFPTSKAVVDYVDERVVQEIDAIDVGVTSVNGQTGTILLTIPSKTSDLTNDSGYLTASDIASVMTYKGTKANYAALPASGNITGDVWHLTDTGAEWAWDGSAWQELGTAIDLSGYATKATTLAGYGITDAKIESGTITLGSNTITPLTSYTETDPTVPSWAKASSKPSYAFSELTTHPTTISGYGITDAYTKTEVDNKVSSVLRYKGVKATVSNLPTTDNVVGDVWHVTATSGEYAWDGTEWQELGTAITIPAATGSSTTGISIADHSTADIYGVSSSTTSVTGVSGSTSVYGVKSGTNSTTTASHVKSGGNGTAPTLGTAISIYGVKSGTNSTTTASHVKSGGNGSAPTLGTAITVRGVKTGTNSTTTASKASGGNGSAPTLGTPISVPNVTSVGTAPTWSFSDVTIPIRADADTTVPTAASSATTVPIKNTSATTVPTAASSATTVPIKDTDATACDDITAWSAGSGSLTFAMDGTDTKKLVISHTHTAPSLSYTARSIIGVQSSTTSVTGVSGSTSIYGVQSSTTSVTGVSGSTTVRGVKTGTSSTTTASKASGGNGTAPTLGDPISIPNVTSVGSASTWSFTDVTVPIRADADTSIPNVTSVGSASNWVFEDVTVPIRADSATSIPNVTSVGSASNWVFEDVTVPIRADSATTVPTAASSATTVPIKNGTATTVVTGKTHSVTDSGHTHTI